MLALRTLFHLDPLDTAGIRAALSSHADAMVLDLAAPALHGRREAARVAAAQAVRALAEAGRIAIARVGDTRSGQLQGDLDAVVGEYLSAVILSGAEIPQDVRDADVAIRQREMRLAIDPGRVRLIPEIDSAEGLAHLHRMLEAVDRHSGVALAIDGLREDLRLGDRVATLYEHAMAELAMAAHTAHLPWVLAVRHHRPETASLPARARDFGAAGVTVHDESEVDEVNALFNPDPQEVAVARATLAEWERVRARGEWVGVVAGEMPEASTYDRLVDRRTVRRARALLAYVEAIAAREAAR